MVNNVMDLMRQIPLPLDQIRNQNDIEYSKPMPFCSRNITWINDAYVSANRCIDNHHQGNGVAKSAVAIGYFVVTKLNSAIAVIELIASSALTAIGFIFCAATQHENSLLTSYTISVFSYTNEVVLSMVVLGFEVKPGSHIQNSAFTQMRKIGSMILTKHVFQAAISPPLIEYETMINRRVISTMRKALVDFLNDLKRDSSVDLARSFTANGILQEAHQRVIQKADVIRQQLNQVPTTEDYVNSLTDQQMRDILEIFGQLFGLSIAQLNALVSGDPGTNNGVGSEAGYKQYLSQVVENAVRDVYRNPELVSILADEEEPGDRVVSGRNAIEGFFPGIYLPLAHYAQFCEIERDIQCSDRILNGTRRRSLVDAKATLASLDSRSILLLKKRLLGKELVDSDLEGVSITQRTTIESLYRTIAALSSDLQRGPLASSPTFSLGSGVNRVNLFQGALQRALASIA